MTTKITITVTVDTSWVEHVIYHSDIFGEAVGYWAYGVERHSKRGWLVFEHADHPLLHRPTAEMEAEAIKAWRAGLPLPKYFHRFDRKLALGAFAEGVRRSGVDWYTDGDARSVDVAIQHALFGKLRYS